MRENKPITWWWLRWRIGWRSWRILGWCWWKRWCITTLTAWRLVNRWTWWILWWCWWILRRCWWIRWWSWWISRWCTASTMTTWRIGWWCWTYTHTFCHQQRLNFSKENLLYVGDVGPWLRREIEFKKKRFFFEWTYCMKVLMDLMVIEENRLVMLDLKW